MRGRKNNSLCVPSRTSETRTRGGSGGSLHMPRNRDISLAIPINFFSKSLLPSGERNFSTYRKNSRRVNSETLPRGPIDSRRVPAIEIQAMKQPLPPLKTLGSELIRNRTGESKRITDPLKPLLSLSLRKKEKRERKVGGART